MTEWVLTTQIALFSIHYLLILQLIYRRNAMYLKSIHASGFKSFADPTHIPIKSHLTAIVGPNGCGKSNVVDAIKWVIGEISAKQLRGQSMTDVIFNGANNRQPVGKAMVELHFDNSDGRIGGQYAGYSEIVVRREVDRSSQSSYYLNGAACRRRDILDVFLGTGLGSRSYSIIEQGMISQMIEAKPEVLRQHVEEVAKTSQYKERRKETQNRMRHTQENLDRLNDLIEELDKQLRHLKRQSEAAAKYNVYKEEEATLSAQIHVLQWQALEDKRGTQQQRVEQKQNAIEKQRTIQCEVETGIEKTRQSQQASNDNQNAIQKTYYECGAEIAHTEQEIQHREEQTKRWQQELTSIAETQEELREQVMEHEEQVRELEAELSHLNPDDNDLTERLTKAKGVFEEAKEKMQRWQTEWDVWQKQHHELSSQAEVARTKAEHYEQQIIDVEQQHERIQHEITQLFSQGCSVELQPLKENVATLETRLTEAQNGLESSRSQIKERRESNSELQVRINAERDALQALKKQQATLEALQEAALGSDDQKINTWLENKNLRQSTRLGQTLAVQNGWEQAVETVLGRYFDAVCVDRISALTNELVSLTEGHLTIVEKPHECQAKGGRLPTLAEKVNSDWPLQSWLNDVFVADSIEQAKRIQKSLEDHESVITSEGVWMGRHFVEIHKKSDPENSILLRKQKLADIETQIEDQQARLTDLEAQLKQGEASLAALETQRDQVQAEYQQVANALSEAKSALTAKETRLSEMQRQLEQLKTALTENQEQQQLVARLLSENKTQREKLVAERRESEATREQHIRVRDQLQENLDEKRALAQQIQQQADELEIRVSSSQNQIALLRQTLQRDQKQLTQLEERQQTLTENLANHSEPLVQLKTTLEQKLAERVAIREKLQQAEKQLSEHNDDLQLLTKEYTEVVESLSQLQNELQELKMEHQTVSVRQATIVEQLQENSLDLETVRAELPEEAELKAWQENLSSLQKRIERLGAINLAAIEEYDQAQERKTYLDKQHADLTEALDVLANAIKKIDRETKEKFRETFDKVNEGLQDVFPRIFGGGKAYLELDSDDLLTAGILVKAQPPGKKNSSIHMLSGGEKALTAIALIFAMFRLNPTLHPHRFQALLLLA